MKSVCGCEAGSVSRGDREGWCGVCVGAKADRVKADKADERGEIGWRHERVMGGWGER